MEQITDLDMATEHLQLGFGQFSKSIENMRDLNAEREGEDGAKAAQLAEAKLGLALQNAAGA